jgi:hypothetical protein
MGQIQTTASSQQKLPPSRRHPIKHMDAMPLGDQNLGGHQASRPCANNGHVHIRNEMRDTRRACAGKRFKAIG